MTGGRPLVTVLIPLLAVAVLPGTPAPRAASATLVQLRFGISLAVPTTWTSTTPTVARALGHGDPIVDATGVEPEEDGSIAVFRPARLADEASVIIMVLPTGV